MLLSRPLHSEIGPSAGIKFAVHDATRRGADNRGEDLSGRMSPIRMFMSSPPAARILVTLSLVGRNL